jgi:hypothetical protein
MWFWRPRSLKICSQQTGDPRKPIVCSSSQSTKTSEPGGALMKVPVQVQFQGQRWLMCDEFFLTQSLSSVQAIHRLDENPIVFS